MVIALRRKDRAIKIDPENIFADNHEDEMTVEGILEGYANIMRRKEMKRLTDLLLEPETGGDQKEG